MNKMRERSRQWWSQRKPQAPMDEEPLEHHEEGRLNGHIVKVVKSLQYLNEVKNKKKVSNIATFDINFKC